MNEKRILAKWDCEKSFGGKGIGLSCVSTRRARKMYRCTCYGLSGFLRTLVYWVVLRVLGFWYEKTGHSIDSMAISAHLITCDLVCRYDGGLALCRRCRVVDTVSCSLVPNAFDSAVRYLYALVWVLY